MNIETDTKKRGLKYRLGNWPIMFVSQDVNFVRTQSFSTQFSIKTSEKWPSNNGGTKNQHAILILDRIFGHRQLFFEKSRKTIVKFCKNPLKNLKKHSWKAENRAKSRWR